MDSIEFSPGMRIIVRDEEWTVKKVESNTLGSQSLHCVGISPLVKDKKSIFITELENIDLVNPAATKLVADDSPFFRKSRLYMESQWRQQIPTDADLHIGDKAAMDAMNYQLEPAALALGRPRQRILIAMVSRQSFYHEQCRRYRDCSGNYCRKIPIVCCVYRRSEKLYVTSYGAS